MTGTEVSIRAVGDLPEAVLAELEGLVAERHEEVVVLRGWVADQAALMGVLNRLHRTGLLIYDVSPAHTGEPDPAATPPSAGHSSGVEISVVGLVADLLTVTVEGAELHESPATTTLRVRLEDPGELLSLLTVLEASSLEVREIHCRPLAGSDHDVTTRR